MTNKNVEIETVPVVVDEEIAVNTASENIIEPSDIILRFHDIILKIIGIIYKILFIHNRVLHTKIIL